MEKVDKMARSNQVRQGDGPGDQTLSTVSSNDSQKVLRTIPVILSTGNIN